MATKSFISKINAVVVMIMACVVTLFASCKDDDVANTEHSSFSVAKRVETSNLTVDNYYGTGTLSVKVVNTDPQGVSTEMNGDAVAKCTVSPESDPVETSNMNKSFSVGKIEKSTDGKTVTCDITVNGAGQENVLKCRVVVDPVMVFGTTYSLDVKDISVDEDNVRIVDVSKQQGETGRQAVQVPVIFTVQSVGTELDTEADHTKEVTVKAQWEQFQKQGTPVVDHEEFDHAYWKVNPDFSIDYMVVLKQVWTEGHEDTFVEYPYNSSVIFNVIEHEDKTVKSWAYGLKNIEGLSVGTPYAKETGKEFFSEKRREDLYAATHSNGQDTDIKAIYSCDHPEVTFTKGDITYTFNFVSPSFSENSDDLLDGTSMKSGYDLKIFRNAVTGKYGNQESGVQEKVLEERCNLYKAAKAAKGIELQSKTKTYKLNAIDYTAKYYVLYTDDTKSDLMTATTSRPWELNYLGYWSMSVNGEVAQSTTAISMTKAGSSDEEQSIANGKWLCTTTSYNLSNTTTVDGQKKDNKWEAKVPTRMKLTLYGTEIDFGEDTPKAEAKDMSIALTNSTATQEDYKFTENLNFTVGDYTTVSEGYGFITKAVEVKVKSWSWENAWLRVDGNLTKAHVDKVYVYTDGSTKTVSRDFTYTRNSQVITYWETTEANNNESTGAAQFSVVSNEAKSEGDWKFNLVKTELKFGVTCAGSTQTDGWSILEANNLSVEIEGDVYTFDEMSYSASANASQTKTAESDNQTTYTHTNTPNYTFGGYSMSLASANGKIFVAKAVIPEHHNGFFPESYGKLEGDNKAACRNPHNQKDWGIGGSLKFTNGSLPYFISKDGIIEFGEFESGSTVWNASSPDANSGKILNCNAKDASTAMKWMRDVTINMLSYSDGTLMGFNDGHNTVSTSKFPGTIEQHDGGKWQSISFAGARTSDGRSSFDTSF
jgi:hypothetical protein